MNESPRYRMIMAPNRSVTALTIAAMLPLLSGCIAKTAASIVTAPVRVVSKGADWATTSQSEADEKRGRELRKREARLGKIERDYRNHSAQCSRGDRKACARAEAEYAEIQQLLPTVPVERN